MKNKVLSVNLGERLKEDWVEYCLQQGETPSSAIRQVLQKLTQKKKVEQSYFSLASEEPDVQRKRVEIRLTGSEYNCIVKLSQDSGCSVNTWLINLVRANLLCNAQFSFRELEALGKSNSELLAIGRNLNQIARWMNGNLGSAPIEREQIEALHREIILHTKLVTRLVRANIDRWVVK